MSEALRFALPIILAAYILMIPITLILTKR